MEGSSGFDAYLTESDGKRYRVPYRMIKSVTFTELDKKELIDVPHAARLQYRLMLLDPVIKARVDYTRAKINVLYNHDAADNNKEKISLEDLIGVLSKEGIHINRSNMVNEDYNYYKNFYSYAYNPPSIRETAPYGYTMEQWREMRPEWEAKMKKGNEDKMKKFKDYQESYLEQQSPEMAQKIVPGHHKKEAKPLSLKEKIFGRKGSGEKGFWFHGI